MDAVERQVTLPVSLDEAWELLTRADELAAWLGTDGTVAATPGATGAVVDPDGTVRHLVVEEVLAGRRLAWRWWEERAPEHVGCVEITVAPVADGTSVRVREVLARDAAPSASVRAGEAWSHRLLHLEALLLVAAAVRG
jgi:uncharacterized protein YndB with AHSA1/START domain